MGDAIERGTRFQELHRRPGAFLLPNPWDAGTARLLAGLGFEALATTSAGFAFSQGLRDNCVGRDAALRHVAAIAAATPLPVSADLENGFGDAPETVAETIRRAAAAGAAGASIEDAAPGRSEPQYPRGLAVERIAAAVEARVSLPAPFTLTARAENFLVGPPDLGDTIARLQAYQEAGADVLYAPGLRSAEDVASLVAAVDRPVNVLAGRPGLPLDLADLARLGVRRVSVGSALARASLGAFVRGAREMRERGTFGFSEEALSFRDVSSMFEAGDRP
jgi:2-methylisocitrate lyase-like PEP mutase family enzyme